MPSLNVQGTRLEYVERGKGDPVVLVHGALEDYRSWNAQLEFLSAHFRVVAYSRRYHYPNAVRGDESDYTPALHAADLLAVLDTLSIHTAHLVGESYGAYVALYFAVQHPWRVRSLVLGEPPIFPWLLEEAATRPIVHAFYRSAWEPAHAAFERGEDELGVSLFVNGVGGAGAFERLGERTRAVLMQNAHSLRVETQSADYFMPLPLSRVKAELGREKGQAPHVLLLGGQLSPGRFAHVLDCAQQALPQATRQIVPNSGHAMNLSNPSYYNRVVLDFLRFT